MENIYNRVLETLAAYKLQNKDVMTEEAIKDLDRQIKVIKEDAEENEDFKQFISL